MKKFRIGFQFYDCHHRIVFYVQIGSYRKAKLLPFTFSSKTSWRIQKLLGLKK